MRQHCSELLTSVRIDGEWHAVYPTALRTLCGLEDKEAQRSIGRYPPTCEPCLAMAVEFDEISTSTPEHWGLRVPGGNGVSG